jgi:hypothetical protein
MPRCTSRSPRIRQPTAPLAHMFFQLNKVSAGKSSMRASRRSSPSRLSAFDEVLDNDLELLSSLCVGVEAVDLGSEALRRCSRSHGRWVLVE